MGDCSGRVRDIRLLPELPKTFRVSLGSLFSYADLDTLLRLGFIKVSNMNIPLPLPRQMPIQIIIPAYTSRTRLRQRFRKYSPFSCKSLCSCSTSWIGSINAFMTIMGGLSAGKLFDKGYLQVPVANSSLFVAYARYF